MGKCHLLNNKFTIVQKADVSETLSRRLITPRLWYSSKWSLHEEESKKKEHLQQWGSRQFAGNLEMTDVFWKK